MAGPVSGRRVARSRIGSAGAVLALSLAVLAGGCEGERQDDAPGSGPGAGEDVVRFTVPQGAGFRQVADTLVSRDLVGNALLFRVYAKVRGDDGNVRAGQYAVAREAGWKSLLDDLVAGRVETVPVTIPEGWTLRQIAERLATITGLDVAEIRAALETEGEDARLNVPGPGLEGYLFPDTYRFSPGTRLEPVVQAMVAAYKRLWTPERRARAEELEMTEREVMTLASIVQAEARQVSEMPRISAVFHNRLRIGYLLQADPTVQYALGDRRSRLLYRDIDAVADNPYNTYTNAGLPPGPIGAAGVAALEATLWPEDSDYLYFVARPDGSHIFTRSLEEHNRARVEARRQWDALERGAGGGGNGNDES
ncbi:MAG: endolytic transglycosylase MltG [Gemmatimonadales bacterium]|nr:MAG: endolytic transglycosylase MltG [Gemmatimonadales bacterium]